MNPPCIDTYWADKSNNFPWHRKSNTNWLNNSDKKIPPQFLPKNSHPDTKNIDYFPNTSNKNYYNFYKQINPSYSDIDNILAYMHDNYHYSDNLNNLIFDNFDILYCNIPKNILVNIIDRLFCYISCNFDLHMAHNFLCMLGRIYQRRGSRYPNSSECNFRSNMSYKTKGLSRPIELL